MDITSKVNVIFEELYEPSTNKYFEDMDNHVLYKQIKNGPTSICMSQNCHEPVFTEAWITVTVPRYSDYFIPIIAVFCSQRLVLKVLWQKLLLLMLMFFFFFTGVLWNSRKN